MRSTIICNELAKLDTMVTFDKYVLICMLRTKKYVLLIFR